MIIRSTLPALTLPNTDFSTVVLDRTRRLPKTAALIDAATGERITYGHLIEAIDAMAVGLLAHGLRPGDVVVVCGFNSPADAVVVHAVWRAGGVVATMSPLLTVREMEQALTDAGARYLVATSEPTDRAVAAAGRTGLQTIPATCAGCETDLGQALETRDAPPSIALAVFAVGEGETGLGVSSIGLLAAGRHRPPRLH